MTLSEKAKAYYGLNDYYEVLSQAEDYPNYILKKLIPIVKNKVVLDAGCGTGKYLELLQPYAKELYGVDAAKGQLEIAKNKINKNIEITCSDLEKTKFKDNTFDVIYSTWALSTILDNNKKEKVLKELLRILKKKGKLILVENDIGGEFETIRGRYPNITRTKGYNDWVIKKGFKEFKKIKTYFLFDSNKTSKEVFKAIYNEETARKVNKKIKHNVIMYCLCKL
ncbi:MAG TPA: class I SAM-dependent methyltransferase [archaeon]|nr:class I SAM-dependent methyltransferase [archaeon]